MHFRSDHPRDHPPALYFYLDAKLIAGAHRLAKLGAFDAGENHQLVLPVLHFGQQESASGLSDRFYNQNARHDRKSGKMSVKKRFVDSNVLDRNDAFF